MAHYSKNGTIYGDYAESVVFIPKKNNNNQASSQPQLSNHKVRILIATA